MLMDLNFAFKCECECGWASHPWLIEQQKFIYKALVNGLQSTLKVGIANFEINLLKISDTGQEPMSILLFQYLSQIS